jgi:hypothetical protein
MPRVDPDLNPALFPQQLLTGAIRALPLISEDELETPPLPREHPKWVRDAVAVSQRARAIIQRLGPIVVQVLTFWDHHARSVAIGGRRLEIDPSGSYRLHWDF